MQQREPMVYIMASGRGGTLYVGVTSNLSQRVWQHRAGQMSGFTKRYSCKTLVYFDLFDRMEDAIAREKQIKAGSRLDKIRLIENMNPLWADLYETLV